MSSLTRDALLKAASMPLPRERVDVPELGGEVFLQCMSGRDRDAWEKSLIIGRGKRQTVNTDNIRAKLVVRVLVTEAGDRLLTDADADALGGLRVDVLTHLFSRAQTLNGVSDEDVDELGKFSAGAVGNGSPTS